MKNLKKILAVGLISVLALGSLAGCASGGDGDDAQKTGGEAAKVGDPAKKVILVVSFGTSYNDSREKTIGAVENAVKAEFEGDGYEIRRAFTSQIIIDKLKERDGEEINNVDEAMKQLVSDGVGTLVVQPTHVMNGEEYDQLMEEVQPYLENFADVRFGKPLLTSSDDYQKVIAAITEENSDVAADEAVVMVGHGTAHFANSTYACLDYTLKHTGHPNYFIGTVEGYPTIDEVTTDLKAFAPKKIRLLPLMIVAGDHASNDICGDEDDSWKTLLKNEGYEVEGVVKGLGEYKGIQNLFVQHVHDAIDAQEDAE